MVLAVRAGSNRPCPSTETAAGQNHGVWGWWGRGTGRMGERNGLYWDNTGREQGAVREERPQVILPQRELCPPKAE